VLGVLSRLPADCADAARLLADLYHLRVNGEDIPATLDRVHARIGHVQVADVPGRHEPGTGTADLDRWVTRLRQREPGNDLMAHGGAAFAQALSRLGLVDEYRLVTQPAALGAGLPLFKDLPAPLHLELVETTTYGNGVAIHVYRPCSAPAGQPVDPDQPGQSDSATSTR